MSKWCSDDNNMDDNNSDDKDTKRKSRNLSEKKRRDQFNLLVNELSTMVTTGSRKMDKSTVLKSTISFLKNHNETAFQSRSNEIQEDWKPTFLTNEEFTHLVLEAVDGFIIVFSTAGQIFYASESITSLLGYLTNEIVNMSIYDLMSENDHNNLYNILFNQSNDVGQISFSSYVKRGGPDDKEIISYELVQFVGYFRSNEDVIKSDHRFSGFSGEADTRLVFIGTGRVQTPQLIREIPLIDSTKSEFTSRHSLEWKFLFLDHRAPPIIGYLPFELLGTSGYDYYHVDDLEKVVSCHEALMQKGEGTSCYYRFLTKGQQWIWLKTRFYITYHQWNSKPEFIVCTHRVISYIEVLKQNKKENADIHNESSSSLGNGGESCTWTDKSIVTHGGDGSDCTSISTHSRASKQSTITQHSELSKLSHDQPSQSLTHLLQPQMQQQFLKPSQLVTTIPMQQMFSGLPSSTAVLPPLPSNDPLVASCAQNQIQLDLQRKHAELQTIIGQQQAELRRVSEQLLMARLGLLPQSTDTNAQYTLSYQNTNNNSSLNSSNLMSEHQQTTAPSIIVPATVVLPFQHQQQTNVVYNPPDTSTNCPHE